MKSKTILNQAFLLMIILSLFSCTEDTFDIEMIEEDRKIKNYMGELPIVIDDNSEMPMYLGGSDKNDNTDVCNCAIRVLSTEDVGSGDFDFWQLTDVTPGIIPTEGFNVVSGIESMYFAPPDGDLTALPTPLQAISSPEITERTFKLQHVADITPQAMVSVVIYCYDEDSITDIYNLEFDFEDGTPDKSDPNAAHFTFDIGCNQGGVGIELGL